MKAILRFCAIGVLSASLFSTATAGGPSTSFQSIPNETSQIIVRLSRYDGTSDQQGISPFQLRRLNTVAGTALSRARVMSGGARVLALPRELPIDQVQAITDKLSRLPGVVYAVPDRIMQAMQLSPDDPRYSEQWHYYELIGGINLPDAWTITMGDMDVHVAVLDTGILGDHEDLAGQWLGGYDFISLRFSARDGDGRDPDPTDEGDYGFLRSSSWHGSHVAGTIGAATDNNIGVAGIAPGATIQPIRVLGRLGGFTSDIIDGMRWSAGLSVPGIPDNIDPAKVLNMSLGGGGTCNTVWQDAIDEIVAAGSVVVVAAGNSASDAASFSPASCDDVITVAATDRNGDLAYYSNFGSTVEISAPGGDTRGSASDGVLSTVDSGNKSSEADSYAFYQGTSMATPHVAGVAALMFSVNPNLTPAQILGALQTSARPFPVSTDCAGDPNLCGAGILDAHAAVMAITP